VKASPSLFALRLFEMAFLPWMRRRLSVHVAGLPRTLAPDLPLLVVANHISWWDGFVLRELHRILRPRSSLRVLMTSAEYRRNPVLGWIAAMPMQPGSPGSVLRAFRELRRLRDREPSMVTLFFPQGRIWPSQRRPLGFERGVTTLARFLAPVTILPVALHLEPLAAARPSFFAVAGSPRVLQAGEREDAARLEAVVEAELDRLFAHLAATGEGALDSWPHPYAALPAEREPGAIRGLPRSGPVREFVTHNTDGEPGMGG
jgi:1-acyl-sn-glycerol-3-phosphate acyltransferase